jgi:tetratricopeptide (TPR) repeat protein
MKNGRGYFIRCVLAVAFAACANVLFSQDSAKAYLDNLLKVNGSFSWKTSSMHPSFLLFRLPTKGDTLAYNAHKALYNEEPTEKNYADYYSVAYALWVMNRTDSAERMYLKIVESTQPFYVNSYYHSSDVANDRSISSYGYGSYTTNYKNYACVGLCKIYLEKKDFKKALKYIQDADKKYPTEHNCGTGERAYRSTIDELYGLCYEGLAMYDTIMARLTSMDYNDWEDETLIRTIKKIYSRAEINRYLQEAEESIEFVADTERTSRFVINNYGEPNETKEEEKYISGRATISLFGKRIVLPSPDLDNGQVATRELFLKEFKESWFYTSLATK